MTLIRFAIDVECDEKKMAEVYKREASETIGNALLDTTRHMEGVSHAHLTSCVASPSPAPEGSER